MGLGLVADVLRHLKTSDFAIVSNDVGILTDSATQKSNLNRTLATSDCGWVQSSFERQLRSLDEASE
jgi:hypothetical protein